MLEYSKLIIEAEKAINWIKEFVESSGAEGVVVGNSGGKDSATVLAMYASFELVRYWSFINRYQIYTSLNLNKLINL